MSLWPDGLTVGGLTLLTLGTGNQAWAALIEFKLLFQKVREVHEKVTNDRLAESFAPALYLLGMGYLVAEAQGDKELTRTERLQKALLTSYGQLVRFSSPAAAVLMSLGSAQFLNLFRWQAALIQVREEGGEEAVRLAEFYRQATVWAMIMVGSALTLAGAVVVLIRDAVHS